MYRCFRVSEPGATSCRVTRTPRAPLGRPCIHTSYIRTMGVHTVASVVRTDLLCVHTKCWGIDNRKDICHLSFCFPAVDSMPSLDSGSCNLFGQRESHPSRGALRVYTQDIVFNSVTDSSCRNHSRRHKKKMPVHVLMATPPTVDRVCEVVGRTGGSGRGSQSTEKPTLRLSPPKRQKSKGRVDTVARHLPY